MVEHYINISNKDQFFQYDEVILWSGRDKIYYKPLGLY